MKRYIWEDLRMIALETYFKTRKLEHLAYHSMDILDDYLLGFSSRDIVRLTNKDFDINHKYFKDFSISSLISFDESEVRADLEEHHDLIVSSYIKAYGMERLMSEFKDITQASQ